MSHYDELLTELEANLARFGEIDITGVYSMRSLLDNLCGYLKSKFYNQIKCNIILITNNIPTLEVV